MNTKTTLLLKTDAKVKKAAQEAAQDIGIPLSTILNAYLRSFARDRRIAFDAPLMPNARTRAVLDAVRRDLKEKKNITAFSNVDDLIADLES